MPINEKSFWFESCCVADGIIWMSACNFNGLFKGNLKTGEIQYIGMFPEEHPLQQRLHYGDAIVIGDRIYFIPLESKQMHIYNRSTGQFEQSCLKKDVSIGYSKGIVFENRLYLFSTRTTDAICYNFNTNTYDTIHLGKNSQNGYGHGVFHYKKFIFLMSSEGNVLRCFDMRSQKSQDYRIDRKDTSYRIIGGEDDFIYLTGVNNATIYVWSISERKIIREKKLSRQIRLNSWQIKDTIVGNSFLGDDITTIDAKTLDESQVHINRKIIAQGNKKFEIQQAFIFGDDLYIVSQGDGVIYSLIKKEKVTRFILDRKCLQAIRLEQKKTVWNNLKFIYESEAYMLSDFIKDVEQR